MNIEEALDIIQHDPDYMDIRNWTKKHYKAQDLYWKYSGISSILRRKAIKDIKNTVKMLKKREKYERKQIPGPGSD